MDVISNGFKILLIEDNETYRKAVRYALEAFGFTVDEAANGKEGLAKLALQKPSLILSDIFMPEMGGIEMVIEIKKNPEWAKIPIITLTNIQEEIDKSVKAGADEAVFKATVTPKQIADICLKHLSNHN
jgi:CheY-like chemotaxis protein